MSVEVKMFEVALANFRTPIQKGSGDYTPLLIRSGGADSALLAYLLLRNKIAFDSVYITGQVWGPKEEAELKAIKLQNDWFCKNEFTSATFDHCTSLTRIQHRNDIHNHNHNCRSGQALAWLTGALHAVKPRNQHVFMSVLGSDQAGQYNVAMQQAWDSMVKFTILSGISAELEYPLGNMTKDDVIDTYQGLGIDSLYQRTWSCEVPMGYGDKLTTCIESKSVLIDRRYCMPCADRLAAEFKLHIQGRKSFDTFQPIWKRDLFITLDKERTENGQETTDVEPGVLERITEVDS